MQHTWSSEWQTSCFSAITINYVLTRCAWIAKELIPDYELWNNLPTLSIGRVPRDLELKTALLQWLHWVCLINILEMVNKPPAESVKATYWSHIRNLEHLCTKLRKPAQKADFEEEEETDHLILICKELSSNIVSSDNTSSYVYEKIQRRTATRIINAGNTISKRAVPVQAPWELSCLNHHTALRVAVNRVDNDDIKTAKEACFEFQSSDSMLFPSWERSEPTMLKLWWNTDVSSIVCATLLDLCSRPALIASMLIYSNKEDSPIMQIHKKDHVSSISKPNSLQVEWTWVPSVPIFEDEWVQSLEDTPDRFRSSQTKTISLRHSMDLYLQSYGYFNGQRPPLYSRDDIYELIPAEDLLYLSLFDFNMDRDATSQYCGRANLNILQYQDRFSQAVGAPEDLESVLWAWVIDGHPWECLANTASLPEELRTKLQEPNLRRTLFKNHQYELLKRLSDSVRKTQSSNLKEYQSLTILQLVDQNIKYRIM